MATDLEQLISFANQGITDHETLELMVESKKYGFDDRETALITDFISSNGFPLSSDVKDYIKAAFEAKEEYDATYDQLALMLESDRDLVYSMDVGCWIEMIKDGMSIEDIRNIDDYVNENGSTGWAAIFAVKNHVSSEELNLFSPQQLAWYMELYQDDDFYYAINNNFFNSQLVPRYAPELSPDQIKSIQVLSNNLYSNVPTIWSKNFGQQLCQFIVNHKLNLNNFNLALQKFQEHMEFAEQHFPETYDKLLKDTDNNKYFEVELAWSSSLFSSDLNSLNEHIPAVLVATSYETENVKMLPSEICRELWNNTMDFYTSHNAISSLLTDCCKAVNMYYGDFHEHSYSANDIQHIVDKITDKILTVPSTENYKGIASGILKDTVMYTLEGISIQDAFDIAYSQFENKDISDDFDLRIFDPNSVQIACIGQCYRAGVPNDVISACIQNKLQDEYDYNEVIQGYEDGLRGDDLLSICEEDLNAIERCERRLILENNLDKTEKAVSEQAID